MKSKQTIKKVFSLKEKTPLVFFIGAEEKTRTSTRIPPLDPEPSASTNSATSATDGNMPFFPFSVNTFFLKK